MELTQDVLDCIDSEFIKQDHEEWFLTFNTQPLKEMENITALNDDSE